MKVLELCTSPDMGGLELYMARTSDALASAGDEVVAVLGPRSRLAKRINTQIVDIEGLGFRFGPFPMIAAQRLARIIDARGIEVIHVHWGKDLPLAAFAKQISTSRPRLVYTRHMKMTRPKQDIYHRWLYRQVDVLLTITELMASEVRGYLRPEMAPRVHTLYHGVPAPKTPFPTEPRQALRNEWGVPAGATLVGLFSRIERAKGQHLLVEAVRQAKENSIALHALIVGHVMDPAYLEELKASIREHTLGDRIHFQGFTDDIQSWMQACDVVALTTREETFGLVLAEAMRAGVVVIGSDRGGVPEIIRHEETGLLFRSFDAEDFFSQLRRLATDPELRERLARQGKREADTRFSLETHIGQLRQFLKMTPESP